MDYKDFKASRQLAINSWKAGKFDTKGIDPYLFDLASREAEIIALLGAADSLLELMEGMDTKSHMFRHLTDMVGIFNERTTELTKEVKFLMENPIPTMGTDFTEGKIQ